MTSPFFTTEKFDYGGYTPPPGSSGKKKKKQPKSSNATADQTGNVAAPQRDTGDNVCIDLFEDDNKDGKKQPNHHQPTKTPKSSAIDDDGGFDYGCIVEETPPVLPAADGILSKYIQETKTEGPRRVSTSPERMKNNSGNSQEEAIELDDDDGSDTDDDDATAMNQPTRNENHPNFNQPMNKPAPKSVNKHPVKSTHPATSQTSTATASSSSRGKKKRPTSSSALLAGFVRQEKLMSASSSTSGGFKKRKKSFYPSASTKGTTKTNQSQKKSNMAVGKRPKGNASLKDFMVPSSILNDR